MRPRFRIMVVDDDRVSRVTTSQQLEARGYEAEPAENPFLALRLLKEKPWDVVVTDLRMHGMTGIDLLKEIRTSHPEVEVILMTAYATVETAVEAMQAGAVDYLVKPFRLEELDLRLKRLFDLKAARNELETLRSILGTSQGAHGLIGQSPGMVQVYERIEMFADHDAPVLITGETGTGKELVARALHEGSKRRKAEFVAIPCGSIPSELAESQLFGHEKGAFTSAHQRREGCFERADGGTVLLDDVDDLPLEIQVKLLRVLQEGTLHRVGGTEEISVDVRLIATSKIGLESAVADNRFRDDLFYRLRGLEIRLPPLRERGEDVLLLAQHFLKVLAVQDGTEEKELSPNAARALMAHDWPGNVRELRRSLESAAILCRQGKIEPEHLPFFDSRPIATDRSQTHELFTIHLDGQEKIDFASVVQKFEQTLIRWALAEAGGRQTQAAALLGLPRTTFQSKLSAH